MPRKAAPESSSASAKIVTFNIVVSSYVA